MQHLSVVIPTLNRAALLARTIDAVEFQTLPQDQYEVIVVDNNSTDETSRVLAQKAGTYRNLRHTRQTKPGAAATRNRGLEMARGEFVVFIDDDIEADPELLAAHLRYHREQANVSVIGAIRARWDATRDPFLRYLRDRGIFNPYSVASGRLDFACYHTGNVSTPRAALQTVGGFDERFATYGMEDIELGYRLERAGCRMVHGSGATAIHHYFPSYGQFIQRCEQAGYSLGLMLRLHPELRGRFTENGRMTRLLRPFHRLYRVAAPVIEPVSRKLASADERRGTGPVTSVLGFHYSWALRYHFFVGYSRYQTNGHSKLDIAAARDREGAPAKKTRSKVPSGSLVP